MSYRVKTVCGMTGISRPTLLAWERRYDILEPRRSPTGHRIYTDDDVAFLRQLKARVDAGYAISEAVRLQQAAASTRPAPAPAASPGPTGVVQRLLAALWSYDRAAADQVGPSLRQLTFQEAIEQVYLPVLRETGTAWAEGRVSIAQEHFVSGWCREQLFAIFHGLGSGPAGGATAVCALGPGEQHELGLLAIAIQLMLAGWRVTWLGADLPVGELCRYIEEEEPDLVCFSVMVGHPPAVVKAWALELRAAAHGRTVVAIGGRCAEGIDVEGVVTGSGVAALLEAARSSRW